MGASLRVGLYASSTTPNVVAHAGYDSLRWGAGKLLGRLFSHPAAWRT